MFDEAGGGGHTQAETEQMHSAATEAGGAAEELDLMLRNLIDNLSPLMVAWTGKAGTTFQNVQNSLEVNMRALYGALTSIAEDMGISSNEYALSDDEIAANLAAVGNMDEGEITRLLDSDTTEVSEIVGAHDGGPNTLAASGEITDALTTR